MMTEIYIDKADLGQQTGSYLPQACKFCIHMSRDISFCSDCSIQIDGPSLFEIDRLILPDWVVFWVEFTESEER